MLSLFCDILWTRLFHGYQSQPTTRNIPEERRTYLYYAGSRITRKNDIILISNPHVSPDNQKCKHDTPIAADLKELKPFYFRLPLMSQNQQCVLKERRM